MSAAVRDAFQALGSTAGISHFESRSSNPWMAEGPGRRGAGTCRTRQRVPAGLRGDPAAARGCSGAGPRPPPTEARPGRSAASRGPGPMARRARSRRVRPISAGRPSPRPAPPRPPGCAPAPSGAAGPGAPQCLPGEARPVRSGPWPGRRARWPRPGAGGAELGVQGARGARGLAGRGAGRGAQRRLDARRRKRRGNFSPRPRACRRAPAGLSDLFQQPRLRTLLPGALRPRPPAGGFAGPALPLKLAAAGGWPGKAADRD